MNNKWWIGGGMLALVGVLCMLTTVYAAEWDSLELSGYGEMVYSRYDRDAGPAANGEDEHPRTQSTLDLRRFVLELEHEFSEEYELAAEIEFEHGGTGAELELEDGGSAGVEIEKSGEIVFEELHLTRHFSPALNVRAGHFTVPIGLTNRSHLPTAIMSTVRPESETEMLPVTWHETGLEVFGRVKSIHYRAQLMNGLDASGFDAQHWIRGGHQQRLEVSSANDMAVAGHLEYAGIADGLFGVSWYYGNSSDNRPAHDMEDLSAHVTIVSAHARYQRDPVWLQGTVIRGHLQNAAAVSERNAALMQEVGEPVPMIGTVALAWWAGAGYDVLSLLASETEQTLHVFARREYVNTMEQVVAGSAADPRAERHITVVGVTYAPDPSIRIKGDVAHWSYGGSTLPSEDRIRLATGFVF